MEIGAQKKPLDIINDSDELKKYRRMFILSPVQWSQLNIEHKIEWKCIKFNSENQDMIPHDKGIYCFVVRHDNGIFPDHGYIFYIGQAGHRATANGNLNKRYKNYLSDKVRGKRVNISEMLNKWEDDIYFYYWQVCDESVDIGFIESELLNSLVPHLNERDFKGSFGKTVKNAWRN